MNSRDHRALGVGAVLLIFMLGYAWVVRPAMARLTQDRTLLAEQSGLLERERVLVKAAPTLAQTRRGTTTALAGARARMFEGDSVAAAAQLSSFVSDVARATGVQVTSLGARNPRNDGGVFTLAVDVRGDGNWRQLLTFLRAVESSARLVEVSQLRLERGARGGPLGGDLISLAATVTAYGQATP